MQKRHPLRVALTVVFGAALFLAGFGVSQFVGYARIMRIVEPSTPLLQEAMAGMTEQDVRDTLEQIREIPGRVLRESDLQHLFEALSANQALGLRVRKDDAAAWSYLEKRIAEFRKRYESRDMQIGDWKSVADSLYQNTGSKKE